MTDQWPPSQDSAAVDVERREAQAQSDLRFLYDRLEQTSLAGYRFDAPAALKAGDATEGALRVLLGALLGLSSPRVIDAVAGSIPPRSVPGIAQELLDAFREAASEELRWRIGERLESAARRLPVEVAPRIAVMLADAKLGRSREMLALALPQIPHAEAQTMAIALLGDTEIDGHLLGGLKKRRAEVPPSALARVNIAGRPWVARLVRHFEQRNGA